MAKEKQQQEQQPEPAVLTFVDANDKKHERPVDELAVETKVSVNRIAEIEQRSAELNLAAIEQQVLKQFHLSRIENEFKPVEEANGVQADADKT